MGAGRQKLLLRWMLAALGCLLLGQVIQLVPERPKTAEAKLYQSREPITVHGVVIRREYPLYAPGAGSWLSQVSDGQRVAAGQTVARWAVGNADLSLSLLQKGTRAAQEPIYTRRMALRESLRQLAAARNAARVSAAQSVAGWVMGEAQDVALQLAAEEASAQGSGFHPEVSAPESGIFVSWADGLEPLLTPESPWEGWALPIKPLPAETVGRLVLGDTWYFRANLSMALEVGDSLEAELPEDAAPVTLEVQSLRGSTVLFSCREQLEKAALTRTMTIKISPPAETGVEIPAEAVYTVGEETGVWRLVGDAVQFQPVTVLREADGQALVALEASEGLQPGDQVLLDYQ